MIYHKPFCYCNLGRQECFVNNCGKRWLYLKVLEKSQKPPKFGTQKRVRKNSVVYHIVHATLINCKSSNFLKQCVVFAEGVAGVGYQDYVGWMDGRDRKSINDARTT